MGVAYVTPPDGSELRAAAIMRSYLLLPCAEANEQAQGGKVQYPV